MAKVPAHSNNKYNDRLMNSQKLDATRGSERYYIDSSTNSAKKSREEEVQFVPVGRSKIDRGPNLDQELQLR